MKDPKTTPLDQTAYWKEEAKKSIQARDQAKERLKEANQKLTELENQGSLSEHVNKFIIDVPCDLKREDVAIHCWLMDKVCEIEETDHIPVRMECNARMIRHLRDMGTILFSPASATTKSIEGCMGDIDSVGPVYLNNSLTKKIRFFIKPITLKPFEFPCQVPEKAYCTSDSFRKEITPIIDEIFNDLGSHFAVSAFILGEESEIQKVATRLEVRNKEELSRKSGEVTAALLKELNMNKAIAIDYPQVWINSEPKLLRYDISICVAFTSDKQ